MRKCIRIAADYDVYFSTGKIYNYQIFDANGIKKHRIIGNNGSHYIYGEQRFNYYFCIK